MECILKAIDEMKIRFSGEQELKNCGAGVKEETGTQWIQESGDITVV